MTCQVLHLRCSSKLDVTDPYQPWQMTEREREIATKYLNFIQTKRIKRDPSLFSLTPVGDPTKSGCSDQLSPSSENPSASIQGLPSPSQEGQVFMPNPAYSAAEHAPQTACNTLRVYQPNI